MLNFKELEWQVEKHRSSTAGKGGRRVKYQSKQWTARTLAGTYNINHSIHTGGFVLAYFSARTQAGSGTLKRPAVFYRLSDAQEQANRHWCELLNEYVAEPAELVG